MTFTKDVLTNKIPTPTCDNPMVRDMTLRDLVAVEALSKIMEAAHANQMQCWTVEGNIVAAFEIADKFLQRRNQ